MEETKRKTKTVRLVCLTRKEPLSQRTVPELFGDSGSTQQVKASTPAGVEVEASEKELPSAWTSLLKKKPPASQGATVSAALSIEKSNFAQISASPLTIHQCLRTLVARLSGVGKKITKKIRGVSSKRGY